MVAMVGAKEVGREEVAKEEVAKEMVEAETASEEAERATEAIAERKLATKAEGAMLVDVEVEAERAMAEAA